jgi:hypothetical protein
MTQKPFFGGYAEFIGRLYGPANARPFQEIEFFRTL